MKKSQLLAKEAGWAYAHASLLKKNWFTTYANNICILLATTYANNFSQDKNIKGGKQYSVEGWFDISKKRLNLYTETKNTFSHMKQQQVILKQRI